jgi:hypothetical protein
MKLVVGFFRFWYDFIVGDDWRLAAGSVAAVVLTTLAVHHGVAAWWLLPCAVAALLLWSVLRVGRG